MNLKRALDSPRLRAPRSWGLLGLFTALAVTAALAAPGDLDLTFSTDGKTSTGFGSGSDFSQSMAVQTDGKILLGGTSDSGTSFDFALARFLPNGTLDTSFSTDGKLTTDFGGSYERGYSVVMQTDGKILMGGFSSDDFGLVRYLPDGTLDPSFGTNGKVVTDFDSSSDFGQSVAVQADGKILMGGFSNADFGLVRYLPDGTLDPSFGTNGKVVTDFDSSSDFGTSVAVQADSKILLGGYSDNGGADFALARYLPDGTLDPSFGTSGKVTTGLTDNSYDQGYSVKVQQDGKILLGGTTDNSGIYGFALVRYLPDGSSDTGFDTDGKLTTVIGNSSNCYTVALEAGGKILLGGDSWNGTRNDFALARYLPDGSLDPAFDGDGTLTTAFDSSTDLFGGYMAVQADGKILLGGYRLGGDWDFALVRYLGDPTDTTPPTCRVGGVVSGATVYVPVTVSDSGSGVAQVQLTTQSTNCKLEWDGPGGLVTVPIGGTIPITPAATSTVVRAVKLNNAQKARVELRVTDASGNSIVCDPVIANLDLKKGRQLVRTFKGIPAHEHYVTLQNGTPGLATAKLQVNGKTVSSGTLTDGQVVTLDVAQWMRPGTKNTVRIAVTGPKGGTAVLLIGDASLAGGAHDHGTHAAGVRQANLEFSR